MSVPIIFIGISLLNRSRVNSSVCQHQTASSVFNFMSISTIVPSIIQPNNEIITKKQRLQFFIWEPIVAGLLIFPLSLIFWQSTWNFTVECLSTPVGQHPAALLVLYLISQLIFLFIYLNNNHVYKFLAKQKRPYISYVLLQLYTFVNGVNYVVQWTTIWMILDTYTGEDWVIMLISSVAAIFILIAMMGHPCDLVCGPFVMSYDSIEYNVRISMVFNTDHVVLNFTSIYLIHSQYLFLDQRFCCKIYQLYFVRTHHINSVYRGMAWFLQSLGYFSLSR